jgi:hypothetical protein
MYKQPFENMWSKYIKENFSLYIACFWIKNSNFGRFVFQIYPWKKKEKHIKIKMTNVYYAVVNSTSCIKNRRKKKQITFHIKSFTLWFHAFNNIFMHTFMNRDGVTGFNIRSVRRSQFSVQYWTFFGTSIFGYIFFFFEVHRKRITL